MEPGFQNLDVYLKKYDKFVISTHESPDADGLGAEIAFIELLKFLGKKFIVLNSDPTPETVVFIDIDNDINILTEDFILPNDISEYSLIVLDTNVYENIGSAVYNALKDTVKDLFVIDHHEGGDDKLDSNFIRVEASSCCEIIYDIIHYYRMELNFKSAQAIYTGMLFDTASFRYPKTSPHTYKIAAHCIENGADQTKIYENLYERHSLSSFELKAKIAASLKVLENGRLIVQSLTPEMLTQTGAKFVEGESTINNPLTVDGVIASVLVKQDHEGPVKISMRTKGDYNVADIAIKNGGGGHKNAAGFKSKLPFPEAYKLAVDAVMQLFKNETHS